MGQLKILGLRRCARAALGSRSDLRGFHNTVLGHGAVPLILLGDIVDRCIAAEQRSAA